MPTSPTMSDNTTTVSHRRRISTVATSQIAPTSRTFHEICRLPPKGESQGIEPVEAYGINGDGLTRSGVVAPLKPRSDYLDGALAEIHRACAQGAGYCFQLMRATDSSSCRARPFRSGTRSVRSDQPD